MEIDSIEDLELVSVRIVKIAIPVVITLIIDTILIRFLERTHGSVPVQGSVIRAMAHRTSGISTRWAIYIALIIIAAIIVFTGLIVLLYYYGCVKIIIAWTVVAITALLSYFFVTSFGGIPKVLNRPLDWLSLAIFILNIVVVANMAVFWRAPAIMTQVCLVMISIIMALVFAKLPDWTIWVLLGLLEIYDACVVLCPHGLLNILVKKSQERGDQIPALVYSAALFFFGVEEETDTPPTSDSSSDVTSDSVEADEERGIRLGLGDFCFYGILVTRAARLGWDLAILCIFAVILGLAVTLLLLAALRKPLPALPLSLVLGVVFFLIGTVTFRPFAKMTRGRYVLF
jgi:hypothetical protein